MTQLITIGSVETLNFSSCKTLTFTTVWIEERTLILRCLPALDVKFHLGTFTKDHFFVELSLTSIPTAP